MAIVSLAGWLVWDASMTAGVALAISLIMLAGRAAGEELQASHSSSKDSLRLALIPPESIPLPAGPGEADAGRLTLAQVEEMAVASHPAMRAATGLLQAARGNWLQVGLKPNPEIGYSGNEIGNEGQAGQQGGFVSQEFVTANKLGLNRAVANREAAAAEQQLEQVRLQVLTTARMYFFEVLAAERAVTLAQQLSEIAAQSVRVSELRLQALDIPRSSLLQSQIESDSAALTLQQALQQREAAWRRLATAIGRDSPQPGTLEDYFTRPLPELEWGAARDRVLSNSPELAALRFAIDRARLAVERATAGRVPNVNVQAGAAFDDATQDTIANVQVSIPLPVFNRNQGAIAQACGELAAARAALQSQQLALEQRLAAALRDYAVARQRVARYSESILPAARETLDMINAGYQQGQLEYIQVLAAQQTYARANLTYLQDLETAWKKWAEIEGLLAGTVTDGME
jgi:cobalt-zinc-cadmium efflux system outer membrane protein